uniref:Uncharacterized protein n=1 Tax=Nelumbo nucifera TaxID=4432 RepID=A0A822YYL4_NELNU|nr:TPA_asm: hypothetical protein HUJ06_008268 [Nelumbo nucifera]
MAEEKRVSRVRSFHCSSDHG